MNKTTRNLIAVIATLFPSIALACGPMIPVWFIISAIILFFSPVLIGLMVVREGKRLWFFLVSVLYYFALYLISGGFNLLQSGMGMTVVYFAPFILIIIALIKRFDKFALAAHQGQ
ncbi:MAG: hypothetical protein V3U71_00610 [Cocleimonas sp.]